MIEYSEFIVGSISAEKFLTEPILKACFDTIDTNKDGIIDIKEFTHFFTKSNINEDCWKEIIKEAEESYNLCISDGSMDFWDFELMMKMKKKKNKTESEMKTDA